jgi:Bacteriophage tail sheath protein
MTMPELLAPGVYVEEVAYRARSIDGVSTSTAGFVGTVPAGPTGQAVRVASVAELQGTFGVSDPPSDLAFAVQGFFANGGSDAWVVGLPQGAPLTDGLAALDAVLDLAILCLPGASDVGVLREALAYAERRGAFAIIDPPGTDPDAAVQLVQDLAATGISNGAMYFPPLLVADPTGEPSPPRPPCGHVAGVYARTDAARGVWKAPAGTDASVIGVLDLAMHLTDEEDRRLETAGVNGLRSFPDRGPLVWGARTIVGVDELASEWKYVPVRRFVISLERSIDQGTRWAVFEPNDEPLWAQIRLEVSTFLNGRLRAGAFAGRTPAEAYFVRCDRSTMTQDDLDNGRLVMLIGVAPVRPAEFVIFRIGQWTARTRTEQPGPATGEPGLVLELAHHPVSADGFVLMVEGETGWTVWNLVGGLDDAGPDDAVFALDAEAGRIAFGDGVHGAVPPSGSGIQATYRYGSGLSGTIDQTAD